MKTFAATALVSGLVATASAQATVTLEETRCIQDYPLQTYTIPVNELWVADKDSNPPELSTVCGLKIVSATGVDVNSLSCQAYRDAAGTQIGSAVFNYTNQALIATNPVQEAAVRCNSTGATSASFIKPRQANATQTTLVLATGTGSASSTGGSSSGSNSGNSTVPTASGGPKSTGTGASGSSPSSTKAPTGGAAAMTASIGVIAAAFAAMLL